MTSVNLKFLIEELEIASNEKKCISFIDCDGRIDVNCGVPYRSDWKLCIDEEDEIIFFIDDKECVIYTDYDGLWLKEEGGRKHFFLIFGDAETIIVI